MTDAGWAERKVEDLEFMVNGNALVCESRDVLKVLKAEHARAVRIVKATRKGVPSEPCEAWKDGYMTACDDILTALQRGRGGKG